MREGEKTVQTPEAIQRFLKWLMIRHAKATAMNRWGEYPSHRPSKTPIIMTNQGITDGHGASHGEGCGFFGSDPWLAGSFIND
jgi:hypothetical protein